MGDGTQLSGTAVQHTYATPGGYEVRLTVADQAGLTGTASKLIQVSPVVVASPPTAVIIGPDLGDNNQVLTFDGSQSAAGSAPIAAYDWDMGDGVRLTDAIVTYVYTVPVRLKSADGHRPGRFVKHGDAGDPSARPSKQGRLAVIAGPGSSAGEPVTFGAANSQQGSAAITSYRWQSGDGWTPARCPTTASLTPTHGLVSITHR
ncbi:MAG: PKD domain-containing protein [Caldilineales bacterium]